MHLYCYSCVSAIWQPGAVTLPLTAARCTNMADMLAGELKLGLLLRWGLGLELRFEAAMAGMGLWQPRGWGCSTANYLTAHGTKNDRQAASLNF